MGCVIHGLRFYLSCGVDEIIRYMTTILTETEAQEYLHHCNHRTDALLLVFYERFDQKRP